MTLRKMKNHIRYRLTRMKTYLAVMMGGLAAAMPYLAGTEYLDTASKAMAACAFVTAIIGGDKDAAGPTAQ